MSRSSPTRARLWAPLTAALLTVSAFTATPALAGDAHKGEIPIESWSLPTPTAAASPLLQLACASGTHYDRGTGKTMAAEVVASHAAAGGGMSAGKVSYSDLP